MHVNKKRWDSQHSRTYMRMRTHILSDTRTHAHTHTQREELENAQKERTQTF